MVKRRIVWGLKLEYLGHQALTLDWLRVRALFPRFSFLIKFLSSLCSVAWCVTKRFISTGQTVERASIHAPCKKSKLPIILRKQAASPPRYIYSKWGWHSGPVSPPWWIPLFTLTGGPVCEPQEPALVWFCWPRHIRPTLLQTRSTGWEAGLHRSDVASWAFNLDHLFHVSLCVRDA